MSRHLRALLGLLAALALLATACGDDDDDTGGGDGDSGGDSEEEVLADFCDLDVDAAFEDLGQAFADEDADAIEAALDAVVDEVDEAADLDLAALDDDLADAVDTFRDGFSELVAEAEDADYDASEVLDIFTAAEEDEEFTEASDTIDDFAADNCESDDTTPETDEDTTPETDEDTTPDTDDSGSGSDAAEAIAAGILSQTPYAGGSEEECVVDGLESEFDDDELQELYTADEFTPRQVDTVSSVFEDCLPFDEFVSAAVENQTGDTEIVDCVLGTYEDANWSELFTNPSVAQQALVAAIELCSDGGDVGAPTPNDPESDVSWFDANAGDCFEATDAELGSYVVIDCDDPHTAEIFSVFELPEGEFPGDDFVQQAAREGCSTAIEDYAGAPAADLGVEIGTLYPTEDTWNSVDDREIVCYASGELTGSIFGAA